MKILFTRHILVESSLRIKDENIKKDEESIKYFFKDMFCLMWDGGRYKGEKARVTHSPKDGVFKIQAGEHKLIVKRNKEDEFLLITYARKRECDMIENQILYRIRNAPGKKK